MTFIRRAADRLVDLVAPHAEATAAPCDAWGDYCYCRRGSLYYERRDQVWRLCGCYARYPSPGGCA